MTWKLQKEKSWKQALDCNPSPICSSQLYQCSNMFRIFLPCQTIVLRFPILDIGVRYRYHYDFHRREEHFTVPCRVVRPWNRSEEG